MTLATPTTRQIVVAAGLGLGMLALPLLFPVAHHFPWDGIPGFYAMFGAGGCGALLIVSKWLGRVLLAKPADWWGEEHGRDEEAA